MPNKLISIDKIVKIAMSQYKQRLSPGDDTEKKKLKFILTMISFGADRDVCNDLLATVKSRD